jgi:glycosyltransferase involved in cell wall biosynthesis
MKVLVFVITYNCADVLPYFLRHYSSFADEISAFDDFSNDGTRELLKANPKVLLRDWPHPGCGINEDLFLAHWREWYPKARGRFDWVMIVDPDEILYHPKPLISLHQIKNSAMEVIRPVGFNMTGDGLPVDDGRQIWEISPMGVHAPVYSKPVIFTPNIKIDWIRGKHDTENCSPILLEGGGWKLLHYRYMGATYTAAKNAKNYARCGLDSGDKGAAWSCSPSYNGVDKEHSPLWAEEAKKKAVNVLEL